METGQPTGIKLPYIVTVEEGSRKVLSIRRNYAPDDLKKNKIQYFVHFKFLPGLGFYGFGLIHMIGGLSRTATAALRQLLDAGTLSNLPAGFKQRGVRVRDEASPIQPGEFKDVDAPGGSSKRCFLSFTIQRAFSNIIKFIRSCGIKLVKDSRLLLICKWAMVTKQLQLELQLRYWNVVQGSCLRYTKDVTQL